MDSRLRAVAGVLSAIVGVAAVAADEVKLTPQFDKAERVYVEIINDTTQKMSGPMFPEDITIKSKELAGFFEEGRSKGDKHQLHWVFDRCMMSFDHPMFGGKMAYDSDSGQEPSDDNSMSLMAAPWVGQKLIVTVDQNCAVTGMEGFADLLDAIDASALGDPLYEQTSSRFTEDATTDEFFAVRFAPLPDEPVSPGDTWKRTRTSENPFLGEVITDYECTLAKVDPMDGRKMAVIEYTSKTRVAPGAQPSSPTGMKPTLRSQTASGKLYVDVATGMPIKLDATSAAEIALAAPGPEGEEPAEPGLVVNAETRHTVRTITVAERKSEKAAHRKASAERAAGQEDGAPE